MTAKPIDPGSASIDTVFAALADPTRRAVIRCLADAPATATELATHVPVSRQAVRKHLDVLDAAGLVSTERSGREVRYSLSPASMGSAVGWMADVGARWDRRLQALASFLANP